MSKNIQNFMLEAPIKVKGEKTNIIATPEQIREGLSWAGKLFFAGAAAFILGQNMQKMKLPIKIRGNPNQMRAVIDAIMSSKKFQQELSKPGATIDSVIDKMQIRNLTKSQFQKIVGRPWPI